jgi:hypothetical protein
VITFTLLLHYPGSCYTINLVSSTKSSWALPTALVTHSHSTVIHEISIAYEVWTLFLTDYMFGGEIFISIGILFIDTCTNVHINKVQITSVMR